MPITVILDLKLKPESVDPTLETLRQSLPDTRAFDGCLAVDTYVDADDPTHVVLVEQWEQRADHERYLEWREETGLLEAIGPLVERPLGLSYYQLRDDIFSG